MIHGYWLAHLGIPGTYGMQDVAPEAFTAFFTSLPAHGYVGANITVPHKEAAFRLVDRRDAVAEAVGAVNTVWFEHGELVGGNSDTHGFLANLDSGAPGWDARGGRAIVLGAGGAARSAVYGLSLRGFEVAIVNRTVERAVELAMHFGHRAKGYGFDALPALVPDAKLLVNCTSLGMVGKPPLEIDIDPLPRSAVVCDMVYVPLETPLLAAARERGHRAVDGLGMLLEQAGFGFEKWFGVLPKVDGPLRELLEADIRAKTGAAAGSK